MNEWVRSQMDERTKRQEKKVDDRERQRERLCVHGCVHVSE